jgi:hypothetical protein
MRKPETLLASAETYRSALLPLMFDLIYAPSILAGQRQIVNLFKTAFRIAAGEIGPGAELSDFRWNLRNAGFTACLAIIDVVNQTDSAQPLRDQVTYVFRTYIRSRGLDPAARSRNPLEEPDERSINALMLAFDAEIDQIVYPLLAAWESDGPESREAIRRGREKREKRFIADYARKGIEVTCARIQRSAGISRSTTYFAWRAARRHKDGSDVARAIEGVLAGRKPLLP